MFPMGATVEPPDKPGKLLMGSRKVYVAGEDGESPAFGRYALLCMLVMKALEAGTSA
jgi:hypothetical protein